MSSTTALTLEAPPEYHDAPPPHISLFTSSNDPASEGDEHSSLLLDDELPEYTPDRRTSQGSQLRATREPSEHVFQLRNATNNKPWVTFKLKSDAMSSERKPVFFEEDPIRGSLEIDLSRNSSIHTISVQVSQANALDLNTLTFACCCASFDLPKGYRKTHYKLPG